ncbi:MAG: hypothetical protein LBJ00_04535 [Planctomycetaceae bacterium]|nr:hypothetical protein [Planctomycetaceae bacterium]
MKRLLKGETYRPTGYGINCLYLKFWQTSHVCLSFVSRRYFSKKRPTGFRCTG